MTPERWQRVKLLFARALDHPADDRVRVVIESDETPSIIAKVRKLLSRDAHAGSFLISETGQPLQASPVSIGDTVGGHFRITSELGHGGMGIVYGAQDLILSRPVALKFLSGNEDTLSSTSRVIKEARAIAAFNHPNIVSVYDFGVEADRQYIVCELVEGSSLRSLLTGKPVPLRKLLDIATQVADGLAAAHAAGFVHRDLKPENIMLTKDGRVKIVDFGLARQDIRSGGDSASTLPFAPDGAGSGSGTKAGMMLGTPKYMSPEQAVGKPGDFRSDQFSFGLILYELASGKQAFAKDSSVETMAAIVGEEPAPLDEKLPAPLRWIIDRCLQKEPEQRYDSTRDLYQELRNLRDHLSEAHSSGTHAPVVANAKRRRWKIATLCAICLLLAGLLGYLLKPSGPDVGNYRYTPFATDTAGHAIWSPDGKAVAYASKVNSTFQVFLRYLNSPVPIQLTHEKLDTVPFGWSSDRSHLIVGESGNLDFFTEYKLYSLPTVGGQPEFIMDAGCYACDLSGDGKALAALTSENHHVFLKISDPLGSPLRPYKPDPFNPSANRINASPWVSFSPDGKRILLLLPINGQPDEAWLLPFPPGNGSPRQISIFQKLPFFAPDPSSSWMTDNRNVVISIQPDRKSPNHLWLANINSPALTPVTTGTNDEYQPSVSPDGRSILYSLLTWRFDVTSVSVEDGTTKTLITTGHCECEAAWSANQAKLAWVTNRSGSGSGSGEIWIRLPDGSERPAVTGADFPGVQSGFGNPSLSPDGERIIYVGPGRGTGQPARMWISSLNGGPPVQLTNTPNGHEWGGSWSPDGSQFAYFQSGPALMIVKTSGNATPSVLTTKIDGSVLPDWSPTGEWIAYRNEDGWWLTSPDGKISKHLGKIETPYLAFSKNGKLLYGIETGEAEGNVQRATLFSLDLLTLKQKVIKELGKELAPQSPERPGIRFSLAPDGKSFVYNTAYSREDLWMLTGYRQPGWRARFSDLFESR